MSHIKAVSVGILGITRNVNDYAVHAIGQPEAAYIPDGGVGQVYTIDVPPKGSGTSDPATQKIAVKVFITNSQVTTPEGQRYKVGLIINAVNDTVNIGPFFGNLDFNSNKKALTVKITTPLLNGTVSVTLQQAAQNKINVKADFTGLLSGITSVSSIPN